MADATSKKPENLEDALTQIEDLTKKLDEQKEHARTWEQRAKDNKDAAPERDTLKAENGTLKARVAELETAQESGQSDVEKQLAKLTKEGEATKAELATEKEARVAAERAAMRTRIGTAKGLPATLHELLKGDDEDAITKHADDILAELPKTPATPGVPGQGNQGEPADGDKKLAAFAGALPSSLETKEGDK